MIKDKLLGECACRFSQDLLYKQHSNLRQDEPPDSAGALSGQKATLFCCDYQTQQRGKSGRVAAQCRSGSELEPGVCY